MKTRSEVILILLAASALAAGGPTAPAQQAIEGSRDEKGFEVVYPIPPPSVTLLPDGYVEVILEGEGFQKLFGPPGSPVLPVRSVRALLPPDREVKEVEVIPGKKIAIEGKYRVEFARAPRPVSAPALEDEGEMEDLAIYSSSNPYPGRLGSGHTIQHLRGYPILVMLLNPVEYLPAEGKLFYYESLTLRVRHGPEVRKLGEQRIKAGVLPRRDLPADREAISGAVDNPGGMKMFAPERPR
jgi:hypothetical protein